MSEPYTQNNIINIDNKTFKAIAGRKYKKGEIVDKTLFITDKFNNVHEALFKRKDIVPLGIMNFYTPSITNTNTNINVELDNIDDNTRFVTTRATNDIEKGDILTYKSFINKNPINNLVFQNYVHKSTIPDGGLGVFAGKDYKKDDIVSINPFILSKRTTDNLKDYVFLGKSGSIFVQGEISIMNHSYSPNVNPYNFDYNNMCASAKAVKDISKGEELFVSYGKNYWRSRNKIKSQTNAELPKKDYTAVSVKPPAYPIMRRNIRRRTQLGMLW